MEREFLKKLQKVLLDIFKNRDNFYHRKYLKSGITKKDVSSLDKMVFQEFPPTLLEELAKTPIQKRSLENHPRFNKLIFSAKTDSYFILRRNLKEISQMSLPIEGSRPLVIMQDVYEAIEYCLFFYEQKILPLIGEILNPAVVYATSKQYQIDSIYTDCASIDSFYEGLMRLKIPIKSVTIIDCRVDIKYAKLFKGLKINYVISLPEFGPVAYACQEHLNKNTLFRKKALVFHPYDDTFVEAGEFSILSSVRLISCPMIRYKSGLHLKDFNTNCSCGKQSFVQI